MHLKEPSPKTVKKMLQAVVRFSWTLNLDQYEKTAASAALAFLGAMGAMGSATESSESLAKVQVTLEDLELPPRREPPSAAAPVSQLLGQSGGPSGPSANTKPKMTEELLPGAEAKGQRAFHEDGLVGTEGQQLQLLAYYAELCEDFRHYQRSTREDGAALQSEGAQLLLLQGPPGTGKTRHAVSFARALGLPLLAMNPTQLGVNGEVSSGWASSIRHEIRGRDCILFLDEIDQFGKDEAFASGLRQFLDGVCQPSGSKVLVVGTSNRIDRLPADVLHRAELVNFERPEQLHLATMWKSYAKHLNEEG